MYRIAVDTHTHTIASGHAYSTVYENLMIAKERGLEGINITEHASPMFMETRADGTPQFGPLLNEKALPLEAYGVRILRGVEVDIVDAEGHLFGHDIELPFKKGLVFLDVMLGPRDLSIASFHDRKLIGSMTEEQGTHAYCTAASHPRIHCLGHIGRAGVPFDIPTVVACCKEHNTLIEINDHSFDSPQEVHDRCKAVALECMKQELPIVVSSDAHSCFFVGEFSQALAMLESIDFPEELIANTSLNKLMTTLYPNGKPAFDRGF